MSDLTPLSMQEFVDSGLLQEVNRQFFHPLGLALAVESEDGAPKRLLCIWDARADDEGFVFDELTTPDERRALALADERVRRMTVRRERLGFGVQPFQEPSA